MKIAPPVGGATPVNPGLHRLLGVTPDHEVLGVKGFGTRHVCCLLVL